MKKEIPKIDRNVLIVVIVALVILELGAMYYGINGTMRTLIIAIIAAIGGITIPYQRIIKT